MSVSKSGSQAANRYAKALFELAKEAGVEVVEKDLLALQALVGSNEALGLLMETPLISREKKEKVLSAILEKAGAQEISRRFVACLARNNRLPIIHAIIHAFVEKVMLHKNEVVAEVTSAAPLQSDSLVAISDTLTEALGKKVKLNVKVERKLLGGLVIKVGSVMLDNSLKSKLDRLAQTSNNASFAA